jgi:hypothetical protein
MRSFPGDAYTTYWGAPIWAKPFDFCYISTGLQTIEELSICFSMLNWDSSFPPIIINPQSSPQAINFAKNKYGGLNSAIGFQRINRKDRVRNGPAFFATQHIVVQAFWQKAVLPAIYLEKIKT